MTLLQKGQCTQCKILLRAGERHTDRMAWVHFDLWSSPVPGVDGCVSGLVWSLPAAPNSPFLCVFVSTIRPACVIICNFAAKKKKAAPRQSSSELTISTELGHRATWNGQCAAVRECGGMSHGDDF